MDSTLKSTYSLILYDYTESKKHELKFARQDAEELPQGEPDEILNGYGLYSIIETAEFTVKRFKLFAESVDDTGDRIQLIDSSEDKVDNSSEYFSNYQNGFWFYHNSEQDNLRIVMETEGCRYESAPICLKFYEKDEERKAGELELIDMVQYVYAEQPLLLLSVFQKSPLSVYIGEDSRIRNSIDAKLALIERCVQLYNRQYSAIVRSLKFKLKSHEYIDRIDKLTGLNADTLSFIARNPQYLVEIKKKKGIRYNGKVYLPEKTIVSKNVVDYGTYENCYILSFLKMLMSECEKLKIHLNLAQRDALKRQNKADLKSQKDDFNTLVQKYQRQAQLAQRHETNVKHLFAMYKTAFKIEDMKHITADIGKPRVTAIFKQIPEYNIFYKEAFVPWFEYGINIFDEMISDVCDTFTTAVSNPSTTYELYIVCMWINFFINHGYTFDSRKAKFAGIHEKESRYSDNAYEFVFSKPAEEALDEQEEITLYYSPSVYLPVYDKKLNEVKLDENNVDEFLYRNTRNSIVSREDKETNGKGAHYEPDFILRYQNGNELRYMLADAKHKDFEAVRKEDMPKLLYKYIDSIKVLKKHDIDAKVAGLCAVYNKHSYDEEELLDTTDYFEFNQYPEEEPFAKMLYMNIDDSECGWENIFTQMLSFIKQFKKL